MLLVRLCRLQVPRQWGGIALKRGSCAPRCCRAPRCRDYGGPQRSSCGPVSRRVRLGWRSRGGLEPRSRSRPVRDCAPTIAPTIFCSDRLAADAGPGRRRSQLPQIRPAALEAPDFVGIGEKPARQDGQRGRRSGGGSVLGYLASWHDRGPGGRHDDGARSRGRGHPRPQTGLDRKWQ